MVALLRRAFSARSVLSLAALCALVSLAFITFQFVGVKAAVKDAPNDSAVKTDGAASEGTDFSVPRGEMMPTSAMLPYNYTERVPWRWGDGAGRERTSNQISNNEMRHRLAFFRALSQLRDLRDQLGAQYGTNAAEYQRLDRVLGVYAQTDIVRVVFDDERGGGAVTDPFLVYSQRKAYIDIIFDTKLAETNDRKKFAYFVEQVAHEGQHAADFLALARGQITTLSRYELEFRGYEISSFVQEAQNSERKYSGVKARVWRKDWKAEERSFKRAGAINEILEKSSYYRLTANGNRGSLWRNPNARTTQVAMR